MNNHPPSIDTLDQTPPRILFIEDIMKLLPHRYPFLLLDRLEEIVPQEKAVGIKNVTINEPFFVGHFPDKPVMPGVLLIEALAQTAAALVMFSLGVARNTHLVYFMSVHEARFRKPVYPGDTLRLKVQKKQQRQGVWKFQGEVLVGTTLMAEALYTAMIVPA